MCVFFFAPSWLMQRGPTHSRTGEFSGFSFSFLSVRLLLCDSQETQHAQHEQTAGKSRMSLRLRSSYCGPSWREISYIPGGVKVITLPGCFELFLQIITKYNKTPKYSHKIKAHSQRILFGVFMQFIDCAKRGFISLGEILQNNKWYILIESSQQGEI